VRRTRDAKRLNNALEALKKAAQGNENLMPFLIEAVKAHGTLGEICDTLKSVFGIYKEPIV